MSEEEKLIEYLQSIDITRIFYDNLPHDNHVGIGKAIQALLDLYNKEKEKNKELLDKNKIIKILGFDENTSNDTIYRNIEILVSEFERLEDIEDRKVQVEYDFVFNQGLRSIEKKIKEKIEELKQNCEGTEDCQIIDIIEVLQELLEERN